MKYLASCSFGKDSLAAIVCRMERGEPIDEAVYCRIMFDHETSAELPEHEEWIHGHAIPLLKSRYGLKTTIVKAKCTYVDCFYIVSQKGKHIGQIYGFPFLRGPWCNSRLKVGLLNAWAKRAGPHKQIVGIAADETARIEKATVQNKILPLVELGITEAEAFEICRKSDLISPAYSGGRLRLGCWFCHNQRTGELRRLRREHPPLWDKLMALDRDSPVSFRPTETLHCFEKRFLREDAQLSLFDMRLDDAA